MVRCRSLANGSEGLRLAVKVRIVFCFFTPGGFMSAITISSSAGILIFSGNTERAEGSVRAAAESPVQMSPRSATERRRPEHQ